MAAPALPESPIEGAHERWIDIDGEWVHTVEWDGRPRDAGPHPQTRDPGAAGLSPSPSSAVVLVHGLGGSTIGWELLGPDLGDRLSAHVTAVDLPGFGRTRADGRPVTFTRHATLLRGLLAERGPAIVVGNSMGGALAVHLTASAPQLVAGLVLLDAAFPRPATSLRQLGQSARLAALAVPGIATPLVRARSRALGPTGVVDATLAVVFADPGAIDPDVRARMIALAEERHAYHESASAYTRAAGSLLRYLVGPMSRDLVTVARPTLVIHGRRDRLVPVAFARAVARRRRDWRYVEAPRCGHAPQLEAPATVVEHVVSWWHEARVGSHRRAPTADQA